MSWFLIGFRIECIEIDALLLLVNFQKGRERERHKIKKRDNFMEKSGGGGVHFSMNSL